MDEVTFYVRPSLNVETYDSRADLVPLAGDVDFYLALARETGGPVLDLGGGTGRVAWPLVEAGFDVTLLDLSEPMLEAARAKAGQREPAAVRRMTIVHGDMRDFDVPGRFGLAITPFRSFQALLTPADQRAALDAVYRHLRPGGVFVVQVFDPNLAWCVPMDSPLENAERDSGRVAGSGNRVTVHALHRVNDPLAQVFTERWEFVEFGPDGTPLRREQEILRMRWTYRNEMRYLLELAGFSVEAEYSDFHRAPPAYAAEQIWIARRPS